MIRPPLRCGGGLLYLKAAPDRKDNSGLLARTCQPGVPAAEWCEDEVFGRPDDLSGQPAEMCVRPGTVLRRPGPYGFHPCEHLWKGCVGSRADPVQEKMTRGRTEKARGCCISLCGSPCFGRKPLYWLIHFSSIVFQHVEDPKNINCL